MAQDSRLARVLRATGAGTWEWDGASGTVRFGEEWLAQLGYSVGDVPPTLEGALSLLHPDDVERVCRRVRAHLDRGLEECECIGRLRHKDGSYQWRRERSQVVERDAKGAPLLVVGLGTRVADFGRAGDQAHPWEHVFQQTHLGLSVASVEDDRYVLVNDAFARMHGYAPEEMIGEHVTITCAPSVAPAVADLVARVARDGFVIGDFAHRRRDGSLFTAHQEITLLRNADGRPVSRVSLVIDTSDREQAVEALREREEQLRLALDAANAGTFAFDVARSVVEFSPRCCSFYGFSPGQDIRLEDVTARTHPDDRAMVAERFAHALAAHREFDAEYRVIRPGGELRWVHARGRAVYSAQGDATHVVGVKHDITDRKAADDQLQASEERFRLVTEATHDVLWDLDVVSGRYWTSPNAARLFGRERADSYALGRWESSMHPDDRARVAGSVQRALDGSGTAWEGEYRFRLADGSYGEFIDRAHIVRDDTGRAVRMIGAMTDVTEVKRAHRSLLEAHARLRAAGREVHLAESRERAALARELHDEFGQLLTAAKLSASWLKAHAPTAPGLPVDTYREKATNLCDVLDTALHGVRLVASQLRPPALDQLGLSRALEGLAAQVERHAGFECDVAIDDATRAAVFGPAEGAAIYRIVQELLTNAARHAGAGHVWLAVTSSADRLTIAVEDDGRGFEPAAITGGWGLKGIRERAELLDGTVAIDSRRDGGTVVRVTLPRGGGA